MRLFEERGDDHDGDDDSGSNDNMEYSHSLQMEDEIDPEGDYPVRVSVDSTLECFVFLSFMRAWELYLVLFTITVYMVTTYEVFLKDHEVVLSSSIKLLLDILYIVDICSSISHWRWEDIRRTREVNARPIFWIFLDILCIVIGMPIQFFLDHTLDGVPVYYSFIVVTVPTIRMYRPCSFFIRLTDMVGNVAILVTFVTYLVIFLVTLHTFACFWYLLSNCGPSCGPNKWTDRLPSLGLTIARPWEYYIVSLYYVTCAMSSTGFGDIQPDNAIERIVTIIILVTGFAILVAAFIGSLTTGILEALKRNSEFRNKLRLMTETLVRAKVPEEMRESVIEFEKSFWKHKKAISSSEMFADLPSTLRKEVCLDRYYLAFTKSMMLRGLPPSYLRDLAMRTRTEYYNDGDVIYAKDAPIDRMIYIVRGNVNILSSDDNESSILTLTAGTVFGDAALLLNIQSKCQVIAATTCELQVVYKNALFAHNNIFHETYMEMNRRLSDRLNYATKRITMFRAQEEATKKTLQDITYTTVSPRRPLKILKNRVRRQQKTDSTEQQTKTYTFRQEFDPQETDEMYIMATEAAVARYDICIKTEWPWILTPDTLFLTMWEYLIVFIVLVVAILYPYFACFKRDIADEMLTVRAIVDVLYFLDIYIQLSTAIDLTRDVLLEIKKIASVKAKEFRFWLDIASIFPAKEVAYYMSFYDSKRVGSIFLLNRVLKMHVVFKAVNNLEKSLNANIKIVRMMKYLLCLVFGSYWIGALIYMQSCFHEVCEKGSWFEHMMAEHPDEESEIHTPYILSFYYALQVLSQTGYGDITPSKIAEIFTMCFFLVIGALLFNSLVSDCSATLVLSTLDKVAYKEIVFVMKKFMEENNISKVIQDRVYVFLDLQWQTDQGYAIMCDLPLFADLSPHMKRKLQIVMYSKILGSVPILQELNDETMAELANCVEIYNIPPGEIVSYAGEIYRGFYIIQEGYCEAISVLTDRDKKTLGSGQFLGVFEMLLGNPSMQDVRSVTHAKLLRISYNNLKKVFSSDRENYDNLNALIQDVRNSQLIRKLNYSRSVIEAPIFTDHTDISWIKFIKRRKHSINIDYMQPFDKLRIFQFIKYLLMSRTIMPNGPFIQFWEKIRVACAMISAFIFPALTYISFEFKGIMWIATALDIAAFLDIYIRLHVCYYDNKGILISHPLSTATHYLAHGFFIDLFGALPLYLIQHQPIVNNAGEKQISFFISEITHLNKVLQLYRLSSSVLLYETNLSRHSFVLNLLKLIPIAFIFVNVLASLAISMTCTYWMRPDGTIHVEFNEESWIGESEGGFRFSIQNSLNLYTAAVYWVAITCNCIGIGDVTAHGDKDMVFAAIVIIAGYLMSTYIIVVVSSGKANVNRTLMLYQERMRHLVSFMKMERIPTTIQNNAIKHFEYIWRRTHGIETHAIFHSFHIALQQDVMLELYEQTINMVPVFNGVEKGFVRQLATSLKIIYYLKGSKIVKKNNIVPDIYIVHRGAVDVIGPDGTIFCRLERGSVFGNIDDSPATRYMMTIVAAKHVDTLMIPTKTFYELARGYPSVKKQLRICVLKNMGYVRQFADGDEIVTRKKHYRRAWFPVEYQKASLLKVPIAYVTSVITLYEFSYLLEFVPSIFFLGLALDVVMLVMLIVAYNTEYYDDGGDIVDDILLIRSHRRKELQFQLDALSIIPIETFSFFTTNDRKFWYNLLRLNRMLRARHLYLVFTKKLEKLNVNMLATKMTSTISSFTLVLHVMACAWFLTACFKKCHPDAWLTPENCLRPYLCSIYFIVTLITSTGFGDITPATLTELIFCSVVSVVMIPLIAMFMGDVSNVVQNYSYTLTKYDTAMGIMKDYLKDGQVSYPLVEKALGYAKSLWLRERGCSQPALLAEAPTAISEEIMVAAYGKHLFENNILRGCHEDLLRQICGKMRRQLFFPTYFLVQEGDCNSTMYFIQRGTVEVLASLGPRMYTVCATLQAKEYFGLHQGFMPDVSHTHTYRAATIVEVLTLKYDDWKDMLVYFPAAYEQIYSKLKTNIHYDYISEKIENVTKHIPV